MKYTCILYTPIYSHYKYFSVDRPLQLLQRSLFSLEFKLTTLTCVHVIYCFMRIYARIIFFMEYIITLTRLTFCLHLWQFSRKILSIREPGVRKTPFIFIFIFYLWLLKVIHRKNNNLTAWWRKNGDDCFVGSKVVHLWSSCFSLFFLLIFIGSTSFYNKQETIWDTSTIFCNTSSYDLGCN